MHGINCLLLIALWMLPLSASQEAKPLALEDVIPADYDKMVTPKRDGQC